MFTTTPRTTVLNSVQLAKLIGKVNEATIPAIWHEGRPVRTISELSGGRLKISTVDEGSQKSDGWCYSTEWVISATDPQVAAWYGQVCTPIQGSALIPYERQSFYGVSNTPAPERDVPSRGSISTEEALAGLKALLRDDDCRDKAFALAHSIIDAARRKMEADLEEEKAAKAAASRSASSTVRLRRSQAEPSLEEILQRVERLVQDANNQRSGARH